MQRRPEWFHVFQPGPKTRPRLYCFPYAGGGIAAFRHWAAPLAPVVELVGVRPAGRESRIREPALTDVPALAEDMAGSLASLVAADAPRPFALYGHSLGAIVAFEVARALGRRGAPVPVGVFVSGARAPSDRSPEESIATLPRDAFLAKLATLEGTPPGILDHEELMDMLLPTLRADFLASERYVRPDGPALPMPLYAYGGHADSHVPLPSLEAWRSEAEGRFVHRLFQGGHFFIHSAQTEFLSTLAGDLTAVLTRRDVAA